MHKSVQIKWTSPNENVCSYFSCFAVSLQGQYYNYKSENVQSRHEKRLCASPLLLFLKFNTTSRVAWLIYIKSLQWYGLLRLSYCKDCGLIKKKYEHRVSERSMALCTFTYKQLMIWCFRATRFSVKTAAHKSFLHVLWVLVDMHLETQHAPTIFQNL